jgi:DNA-binding Xre family transcriptional regulator
MAKTMRTCLACRETKPATDFAGPSGRKCTPCREAVPTKTCKLCRETKPATDFVKRGQKCSACRALPFPSTVRVRNAPRACFRCHERKPADAFDWGEGGEHYRRRRAVCIDCYAAEREGKRIQLATWEEDGELVRRCVACREIKPLEASYYVSRPAASGVSKWAYECKACTSKRTGQAERRLRDDPVKEARRRAQRSAATLRWRARNPERVREANRRHRARIMADPKRAARLRESNRMSYRLRRERRDGVNVADLRVLLPAVDREHGGHLQSAPLAAAAYARLAVMSRERGVGIDELADAIGVGGRRLRAWRTGESPSVQFDVADRVLTTLGLMWWEAYDESDERARRLFVGMEAA